MHRQAAGLAEKKHFETLKNTMKNMPKQIPDAFISIAFAVLLVSAAQAQGPLNQSVTGPAVISRSESSRVWQYTTTSPDTVTGEVSSQSHVYTELEDGICYLSNGQYVDSQDLIEIVGSVAVAQRGPTKVIFSPNAKVSGAIDLTTSSGQRFRGQVASLHYWDAQSGANVTIATVKDCTGTLYPPNLVEYASAFDGINASISYVYAHNGLEQNIVFPVGTILPDPSAYGLNPPTTRLQVWTIWSQAPTPKIRQKIVKRETVPGFPDLVDDILDFGDFWLPTGVAFDSSSAGSQSPGQPLRVALPNTVDPNVLVIGKQWIKIAGLATLIESIDYTDLVAKLASMQKTAGLKKPATGSAQSGASVSAPPSDAKRADPEERQPAVLAASTRDTFLVSTTPYATSGVVLDYTALSGSVTSYTFTNGATYYVQNSFSVSSDAATNAATFQSDCRIKFATNAYLLLITGANWPSTGTAPAYFSSKDDDSILGATPSTGLPYYVGLGSGMIWFETTGKTQNVNNARIRDGHRPGLAFSRIPGFTCPIPSATRILRIATPQLT